MWLLIVISFLIVIAVIVNNKNWKYSPVFLFSAIWFVVFLMYTLDMLNLSLLEVEESSIVLLLIMVLFFALGGVLGQNIKKKFVLSRKKNRNHNISGCTIREKIFFLIVCIAAIVMLQDEITIIVRLVRGASFQSIIRESAGKETVIISGAIKVLLYLFVVYPATYMVSPISAVQFFMGNKNKKYYLFANTVVVALSVVHHGGRNAIFMMMISYYIVFLVLNKEKTLRFRTRLFLVLGFVGAFILINGISASRGIDSIWESFYAYMTCPIPLMQTYIQSPVLNGKRLCGFFSFNGITYPAMAVLNYIGIPKPSLYQLTQSFRVYIEEMMCSIGHTYSHRHNAFMPAGAYLYIDGGYGFEIVGMFIYGYFSGKLYKKTVNKTGCFSRNLSLFCLLSIGLILSFTRLWFTSYGYFIASIYILLIFKTEYNLKEVQR